MRLLTLFTALLLTAPALAQDGQVYFRRKSNQLLIGPNTELKPILATDPHRVVWPDRNGSPRLFFLCS